MHSKLSTFAGQVEEPTSQQLSTENTSETESDLPQAVIVKEEPDVKEQELEQEDEVQVRKKEESTEEDDVIAEQSGTMKLQHSYI